MSDADEKTTADIDIKSLHRFIVCDACGENNPPLKCSRCKLTYYCSSVCQRMHWKEHKPDCRSVADMRNLCEGIGATVPPSDDDDDDNDVSDAVNSECGICLEEEITDPVVLKHCKHAFCFSCLKEWQSYSKRKITVLQQTDGFQPSSSSAAVSSSCPLCRQQISVNLVEECRAKALLYASRGSKKSLPQEERSKCYDLALQQLDKILTENEDRDLATMGLKASVLIHSNPVEAVQLFQKILTLDEKGASNAAKMNALLDRAQNAMDTGNDELADRLMAQVEDFHGKNYLYRIGNAGDPRTRLFDTKIILAEAHEAAGQWKDAADVYLDLLKQTLKGPDIGTPQQNRCFFSGVSRCFYELKLYEKAVHAAESALLMNRHYPGVHKLWAYPQRAMGKVQLAVANMSRSVLYEAPWDDLNRQANIEFLQVLQYEQLHLAEEVTSTMESQSPE